MTSAALPRTALFLALLAALPAVHAQEADAERHGQRELDRVVVRATPLAVTAEELARPVEVLAGERLDEVKAATLGETVSRLPGVQSSYFGPGVGRPIIRGLEGGRVQVLNDGLATGDVSTVSVDHAVSVEPFLADQIEVLKGPATLFYGSGAIGGAVNVVDGRIHERLPDAPLSGRAELRAGSVNDERTGMVRLDANAGRFVFHVDALHRESGDYRIPGFAEVHRDDEHDDHEEHEEGPFGRLPNSALRTDSGALGVSWIGDRGFVGVSSSLFNTRYGVPGHGHGHDDHGHDDDHDEEHEDDGVRIVLDQRRHELRGGLNDVAGLESVRVRFASTDYTHTEFEGDEVGTIFDNRTNEGRLELVHRPLAGWRGAFGAQVVNRNFEAVGDEAFVPPSRGRDTGFFWLGTREFGAFGAEVGLRHDRTRIETDPQALAPLRRLERRFESISASAALEWNVNEAFKLTLGLDRAQRAPTAEELYSNGLHVATRAYEVGTDSLDVETANRIELGAHWHTDRLRIGAAVYTTRFDDFIFLAAPESRRRPGERVTDGGVPVLLWTQADARLTGAEADVTWRFLESDSGAWDLRVFGDVVRGELTGSGQREVDFRLFHGDHTHRHRGGVDLDGNLPRIAPARLGGELRWTGGPWTASLGATRYARQDDVAIGETESPGYTLVDANVTWHLDTASGTAWEVFLQGRNLLDEEARPHTSFLKDLAPLPGRGVAFGIRAFF